MSVLNRVAGAKAVERFGLKEPVEKTVFQATKSGFQALGAANRTFSAAQKLGKPARLPKAKPTDLFDVTPTEEQQMITETVREFAEEQLRPAAYDADAKCLAPEGLLRTATELGVTLVGVPEELGGVGTERSAVTGALIAEAMAYGDMGLAVACLAPSAVSSALVLWGNADQQATYLPSFTGD